MPFFPQFSNLFVAPYTPPPPIEKLAWYKADVGTTVDGNDRVTSWADQSGNSNDATPFDSGYEPLLSSNQINGLDAVFFDPNFDDVMARLLVTPEILPMNYDTPFSAIAVVKANYDDVNAQPAQRWLLQSGDSGDWLCGFDFGPYSGGKYFSTMYGKNLVGEDHINGTQLTSGDYYAILSVVHNGTTLSFYENGTLVNTATPADSYSDANINSGIFTIGAQVGGGSVYLAAKFYLGELMIFDAAINTETREAEELYLNNKWDIY